MTLDEVNTTIYQPRDLIITEAIGRGNNQISEVDKSCINWNPKSLIVFVYEKVQS
jgi:hypothetical protein